ncbi:MAG: hypothetical protein ABIQ66_07325 [Novosphingobium sp.]
MAWKPVDQIFKGGTAEAQALYGKPVKAMRSYQGVAYNPEGQGADVALLAGEEGFVARVPPGQLSSVVLAFADGTARYSSIDALMRGKFKTVLVNWITFREKFQIDV